RWPPEEFALVHVERLYLAPLVTEWRGRPAAPPATLDLDEDDAKARRRLATLHRVHGRTAEATWQEAEADAYERLALQMSSVLKRRFVASDVDRDSLPLRGPDILVVPNAVAIPPAPRCADPRAPLVLFVGTFGYLPNADAATRLVDEVWPLLGPRLGPGAR